MKNTQPSKSPAPAGKRRFGDANNNIYQRKGENDCGKIKSALESKIIKIMKYEVYGGGPNFFEEQTVEITYRNGKTKEFRSYHTFWTLFIIVRELLKERLNSPKWLR